MSSARLAVAMVVLYAALPLLFLGMGGRAIHFIIPSLIVVSVWCIGSLPQDSRAALWELRPLKKCAGRIVARFVVGGLALSAATYALLPQHFLALPRHNPRLWLLISVLYPLLSAYPQLDENQGWRRRAVVWHVCGPFEKAHTSRQRTAGRMRHPGFSTGSFFSLLKNRGPWKASLWYTSPGLYRKTGK